MKSANTRNECHDLHSLNESQETSKKILLKTLTGADHTKKFMSDQFPESLEAQFLAL